MDQIPMTRAGYEKIKNDVHHMESVLMPEIAEKIAAARAEGDLKENAEYHGQREAQGQLQAKINQLRDRLARATIMDPANSPKDEVGFGCTVVVKDPKYGDEEEYTLVGAGEEDFDRNLIPVTGPMAQALLGKKVGQVAEIPAPKGKYKLEVVSIRYE